MSPRDSFAGRPIAALLLALLTGCQAWQPTTIRLETLIPAERPTAVRVTLSDGSILTIKDPIMRNDSIVPTEALGAPLATSDIGLVEVQRFSGGRTIALIVGVIALASTWAGTFGLGGGDDGQLGDPPVHFTR